MQGFWNDLLAELKSKCLHCERMVFKEELIVFGVATNVITDKALDLIILLAKFFIYKCKFQNTAPTIQAFLSHLRYRLKIEESCFAARYREQEFQQRWFPYQSLFTEHE